MTDKISNQKSIINNAGHKVDLSTVQFVDSDGKKASERHAVEHGDGWTKETIFNFDGSSDTSLTEKNGQKIEYHRNNKGQLESIMDPKERTIKEYDPSTGKLKDTITWD